MPEAPDVLDSSAWVELLTEGPHAAFFAPVGEEPERVLVPTITIAEVFKAVRRIADEDAALAAVAFMRRGRLVDLDADIALHAAELGLEHALPLADSVILATARRFGATLWSTDADFEGVDGVRLPQ